MKGRRIQCQHDFGTGEGSRFGCPRLPHIGANGQAATHTVQLDQTRLGAGSEVTFFVEHFVVRQTPFQVGRLDLSVRQQGGCVIALAIALGGVTENQRQRRCRGQCSDFASACPIKIRAQQQVFRRVAAERQLRRQQNIRALGKSLGGKLQNALCIAGEIAKHGIELGDGYS